MPVIVLLLICGGSCARGGGSDAGVAPEAGVAGDAGFLLFLTPSSTGHGPIVDAINAAETSVHMVMYHLTDPAVVQALTSAHARGVAVTVILDQSSLSDSGYDAAFTALQAAGVDVVKSSTAFSITHEKSMVVDGSRAFITSMNMVKTFATTRDYGVATDDAPTVTEWEAVFAADLANAKSAGKVTPSLAAPILVWSPVNAQAKLASLIADARTEISATVETVSASTMVAAALMTAATNGINVRLIVPECVEGSSPTYNYSTLSTLAAAGVRIRVMPNPSTAAEPYMHGKMIVVDEAQAFVGSENFTADSLFYARECGLIFNDATAIATLHATFESDWSAAIALPSPPPTNCPTD